MKVLFSTAVALALTPAVVSAAPAPERMFAYAADSRAEQTCVDAATHRGLRVLDVLHVNPTAGSTEVILRVQRDRGWYTVGCDYAANTRQVELYQIQDSGNFGTPNRSADRYDSRYDNRYDSRYDNHDNSRYDSRYDNHDDSRYNDRYTERSGDRYYYDNDDRYSGNSWRQAYVTSGGVRDDDRAADIARAVVGEQLGINDPYSNVVRVDTVRRESDNRLWSVKGRANGAAFLVRIRANDGYIQDFQLY